jgi:DNA polymerase III subunit delta'
MTDNWMGIFGQEKAKISLDNILKSTQIPPAFLFYGPKGIGKFNTAIRFIQILNSSDNKFTEGIIQTKIKSLSEPYLKYIFPLPRGKSENPNDSPVEKLSREVLDDIKNELEKKIENPYYHLNIPNANNIKINSIRDIKNFLLYNISGIKYRVILIEDAHLMSDESQNALLKSLEEPPQNFIFILITNKPELLFDTIKSRCWSIAFNPLNEKDVTKILSNNFDIEQSSAELAARLSFGSVSNAIELLNHDLEVLMDFTIMILRLAVTLKIHTALKELSRFCSSNSTNSIKLLIKMLLIWLSDVQKEKNGINELYFKRNVENIVKFNQNFPKANINEVIIGLDKLLMALENNVNLNIASLNLIFELSILKN